MKTLLPMLLLTVSASALAGELLNVSVEEERSEYRVEVDMRTQVSPERLKKWVLSCAGMPGLSSRIKDCHRLPHPDPDWRRVRTLIHACIPRFCRDIVRVEDVIVAANGDIRADIVPEGSDLRYGHSRWFIWPDGRGSRLIYRTEFSPDFTVPPVIGRWLVQRELRTIVMEYIEQLEDSALRGDPPE